MDADRKNWIELNLNGEEQALVDGAATLYKAIYLDTIDNVFKIARALTVLQKRYHMSGVNVGLADALVQYGFTARDGGPMQKSIRSDYKALLDHEADVRAWWAKVPERRKRNWLSARAIHKNWKAAQRPDDAPKRQSALAKERERTQQLQEQLREANARLET